MDNTLFTIAAAVCVFLIFKEIHFENKWINTAASHVPAAFTVEWTLRGVITAYMFNYLAWNESNCHQVILLGISVLLIVMGIVIDWLRLTIFGRIEEKLADALYAFWLKVGKLGGKVLAKLGLLD